MTVRGSGMHKVFRDAVGVSAALDDERGGAERETRREGEEPKPRKS